MTLSDIIEKTGDWMDGSGPMSDVVFSSRIRLARNVSGFMFTSRADAEQQNEILSLIRDQVMSSDLRHSVWYIDMQRLDELTREILVERHIISKPFSDAENPRGLILSRDESTALMINEEDHLRMQVLASGLQLDESYDRISKIDDLLEDKIDFAFSSRYGYLTACPTNVGTGMRVSVMLHLPALKITGQIDKIFQAAKDMHLAIRGLFGEGTEPTGDLYQLSNQITLGKSEKQIIDELVHEVVELIVRYERKARENLLRDRRLPLEDKIFRALGILSNARVMSSEEALYLLSFIRLGIHLELIDNISLDRINKIFLLIQPGHLQHIYQQVLDPAQRDQVRAEFIRKNLTQS